MAFCLRHFEMFLVLTLMSLVVQTTATGQSEVWFISYSASCREDINNNPCDPKFTFCLGRPGTPSLSPSACVYGLTGQGGHYQDQNYINFENQGSIRGLSNPWILSTPKFYDTSVMLVVKIVDDDTFWDDDLQTLSQTVWPTVAATKELAQWSSQTMSSGGYTIQFRIRLYCDTYYYTRSCDVYCKAQDTSTGHYTCQDGTGKKMCLPGWTGANCNEDIDECQQGFCKRGVCTNLPGDVRCDCPEHYTGKDCSILMNPCLSTSCLNGGTCYAHPTEYTYLCRCPAGWEGDHCETRKNPCNSQPCLNGGLCNSDPTRITFTCTCLESYTGMLCENVIITTTPLKTTPLTTSTTTPLSSSTTTPQETTTTVTTTPDTTTPDTTTPEDIFEETTMPETTTLETTTNLPTIVSTTHMDSTSVGSLSEQHYSTKQSEFSVWVIALIVIGGLIAILLVVLLLCFIRRRSKQRQNDTLTEVPPPVPPLSLLSPFHVKAGVYTHTFDETKPPKLPSRITSSTPTLQVPSLQAKPVRAEANHYTTLNDIASQNRYNEEKIYEEIDKSKDDSSTISKCSSFSSLSEDDLPHDPTDPKHVRLSTFDDTDI
ncbi:delta-like protein B isoform X2 [Physella acuta]|uniref:delta-like protein B isoform X2 n=1 Tax=Physella acuta TaxID=109671 RepID=UPI0027DDA2EF|nr:delta-like protein B isoform X2 [Physella acuta]